MLSIFKSNKVVTFDFTKKVIGSVPVSDVMRTCSDGIYCWGHLPASSEGFDILRSVVGVDSETISQIASNDGHGAIRFGRNAITCTLVEAMVLDRVVKLKPIHLVIGENFLFTICDGESGVIEDVCRSYEDDFYQHAETGGFLLFELADALIFDYRKTLGGLVKEVELIQRRLIDKKKDSDIFHDFSLLSASLLEFRNAVAAARESVDGLSKRKSSFISEGSQGFLERQALPLDRLAGDVATERNILSETLDLYMGMISYRTNVVVDRLTIVSMVFLPLNFLAAVYGMNFEFMPEFSWRYGYFAFWCVAASLVSGIFLWFKVKKWL